MANFLKKINKELTKAGFEVGESPPPNWWLSSGNYVVNKIISGHFDRGIPQGRLTAIVGPSQSGKSFLLCNIMREAQKENCIIVALDSENALDDIFVTAIGVDINKDYTHIHVKTISDIVSITSTIIAEYKNEYPPVEKGEVSKAPKLLIVLDSLDMLQTDTESDNFTKSGIIKGDMGQRNKFLKNMLRSLVHAIKTTDIAICVSDSVYENQNILNGKGPWVIKDAVQYSLSQILLLTKLKLKNDKANPRDVTGIKMKVESFKSRFSMPAQTVTIEIPYQSGMDPANGLLLVAKELGVVKQAGAWYSFNNEKFQAKNFDNYQVEVLAACENLSTTFLEAVIDDDEEEVIEKQETRKSKVKKKLESS